MNATLQDYIIVALLGALVGIGELVSRYRDAPARAIVTGPAFLYTGLNAVAATVALALLDAFGVTFGQSAQAASMANVHWTTVLAAGFGAMAVLRSSVFTTRIDNQDVPIGPSSFLQIVLTAADRAVDRVRARARALRVSAIMGDVSYIHASAALPTLCFALMQNLPKDDQEAFGRQLDALTIANMNDTVKTLSLGLALMNLVGEGVLAAAVDALKLQIGIVVPPPVQPAPPLVPSVAPLVPPPAPLVPPPAPPPAPNP